VGRRPHLRREILNGVLGRFVRQALAVGPRRISEDADEQQRGRTPAERLTRPLNKLLSIHIVQPAVSRQLRLLEDDVGTVLSTVGATAWN